MKSQGKDAGRVMSCSHNEQDDLDMCQEIAARIPKGWAALILPEDGHPVSVMADDLTVGEEEYVVDQNSMVVYALASALHNETFATAIIYSALGDSVSCISEDKEKMN